MNLPEHARGVAPDVVTISDGVDNPLDVQLCKDVGRKLWEYYPGWSWWVDVPAGQGVVIIKNLDVARNVRHCFVVKMDKLAADPSMHVIMVAGGEILERFNKRRQATTTEDRLISLGEEWVFAKPEM